MGGVAALVDEAAGLTAEVVEAKLLETELELSGPRLRADPALLEQVRPRVDAPPPGVPGTPRAGGLRRLLGATPR